MNRHLIYGRFGLKDTVAIPSGADEIATSVEFVQATKRLDHGIGTALDDLSAMGVYPSEIGVDLLVLAAHIYAADTRISRNTESQDNWTRELRLVVPVSEPVRWNAVSSVLQRMLNFLTGDRWVLGFRPRPGGFERFVAAKPLIGPQPAFDEVSLFSGGLDSLVGAVDALEKCTNPLFVSHAGEGAVSAAQETLFRRLEHQYPNQTVSTSEGMDEFSKGTCKRRIGRRFHAGTIVSLLRNRSVGSKWCRENLQTQGSREWPYRPECATRPT